jgi:hypothetical protein
MNGYTSGDGAPGSASGKNKEALGNTDISLENIVEGGRRKRAKFESSVRNLANTKPIHRSVANIFLFFFVGAPTVRPSANASGHLEPFHISCPSF